MQFAWLICFIKKAGLPHGNPVFFLSQNAKAFRKVCTNIQPNIHLRSTK